MGEVGWEVVWEGGVPDFFLFWKQKLVANLMYQTAKYHRVERRFPLNKTQKIIKKSPAIPLPPLPRNLLKRRQRSIDAVGLFFGDEERVRGGDWEI